MINDEFDDKDASPEENRDDSSVSDSGKLDAHENNAAESGENAEDKSGISADLIRGHINTIILRALYERDKYGYEIINDIERKSHNQYSLKQPTLYSALKRLENQGYILAYWKTDEVSSGGRRKYFTLTDRGKEITERNLAEWEYSRTIIDSLISDRSFDFTQPAPTPVDFTILRNTVSRVPVVREETVSEEGQPLENVEESHVREIVDGKAAEQPDMTKQSEEAEKQTQEYYTNVLRQIFSNMNENATQGNIQPVLQKEVSAEDQMPAERQRPVETDEEAEARRQVHENYLKLISEPVTQKKTEPEEDIVPNSVNVSASKLLYNAKPETERDYKNLINGIYEKALINGSVQTYYTKDERKSPPPKRRPAPAANPIINKGRADGVRVSPSYEQEDKTTYATKTTYNKGLTLLLCSLVVLFVTFVEFIFCTIFRSNLHVSIAYPIVILCIGLVQFAVFGILALRGYGANCVKPMTSNYLSKCIIVTILSILVICVSSFLFHINFMLASDIMKLIVIPSITALNIIAFAVCFKFLTK